MKTLNRMMAVALLAAPWNVTLANDEPWTVGWYGAFNRPDGVAAIAELGANVIVAYHFGSGEEAIRSYLDAAHAAGLDVIVELDRRQMEARDSDAMTKFVAAFDDHPAVIGWYSADEPSLHGVPVEMAKVAYDAVKRASDKPVFMVFSYSETHKRQPIAYASTYDVLMVDSYPFRTGKGELIGAGGWRNLIIKVGQQAEELNRPWWPVLQAFGQVENKSWDFRLPTIAELRFMTYWPLFHGGDATVYWAHYRALETIAAPGDPYAKDGPTWLDEVYAPVEAELEKVAPALPGGPLRGAVSTDDDAVHAAVFRDDAGRYLLLVLNSQAEPAEATVTLRSRGSIRKAVPLNGAGDERPIDRQRLTERLDAYEVRWYELTH